MTARRGSVLIMALWIIAILAVMVVSFAFEARQQAGIDVYVRERNRSQGSMYQACSESPVWVPVSSVTMV